jgi:hypothetical protein
VVQHVHLSAVSGGEALRGLAVTALAYPLVAARGSHLFCLSLRGGEVHHQDPLCLKCGFTLQQRVLLNHNSGLLSGELASLWGCLLLGDGLSSMSLRLLSP